VRQPARDFSFDAPKALIGGRLMAPEMNPYSQALCRFHRGSISGSWSQMASYWDADIEALTPDRDTAISEGSERFDVEISRGPNGKRAVNWVPPS
jgi:hypothetical protein